MGEIVRCSDWVAWLRRHAGVVFGLGMSLVFVVGVLLCFWGVLSGDVIFFAPDAPIAPMGFREAWGRLFDGALTLQEVVFLLPYAWAYEGTFWVDGYVMCLAGVFLLRSRGVSWGAAWVGGFAAAFAGYFFTLFCAGHRGVVDALAVTAVAFGALARMFATCHLRWGVLGAVVLALGLAAQADVWFLMGLLVGGYAAFLMYEGRAAWRVHVRNLVVMGGCFVVLGWPALRHTFGVAAETRAVQLQQAVDFSQGEVPEEARYTFITDWSLPPEDLLEQVVPNVYGRTSYPMDERPYTGRLGMAGGGFRQHTTHVGWVTVLLALVAGWMAFVGRRRREVAFWWGAVGITLVLALGRYTPLYSLVAQLPVINQIRAPVKWLHLTGFALAVLAGMGAEGLVKRFGSWVAVGLCCVIAVNGALVARPYVFPVEVAAERSPLAAALPWDAAVYHGVGAPRVDAIALWNGRRVVDDPKDANVAILPVAQVRAVAPGVQPLAVQEARGAVWGLYTFPILTPSK